MCSVSLERLERYHRQNPNATRADLEAFIQKSSKGKNIPDKIQHQLRHYLSTFVDRPAAEAVVAATNPLNVTPKAQEAIEVLRARAWKAACDAEQLHKGSDIIPMPSGKSTAEWQKELEGAFSKQKVQLAGGMGPKKEAPASEQQYVSSKKQKEAKRAQNEAENAAKRTAQKEQKELHNQEIKESNEAWKAKEAKPKELETALPGEQAGKEVKPKRVRNKQKGKNPNQELGRLRHELQEASVAENASKPMKPDLATQIQNAVNEGKIELAPEASAGAATESVAGKGAEATKEAKGLWAKLKNLANRIGKKGWIGIAIGAVVVLTGIAIHRHNKNKAQNLNVNA